MWKDTAWAIMDFRIVSSFFLVVLLTGHIGSANGALCDSMPCLNDGVCVSLFDDLNYACVCDAGFMGRNCEIDINECESNPCLNGATCVDLANGYSCTCPMWYSGVNCGTDLRPCKSSPCLNGGECSDVSMDFYVCFCTAGYTGVNCELGALCDSMPCLNDGVCVSLFDDLNYACVCDAGFMGRNCEIDINECESNPCLNGATCVDLANGYSCTCPMWYSGVNCGTDLRPCKSSPCLNGGECSDVSMDFYVCFCTAGYTGVNCELDFDDCASNPCQNNATCIDRLNGFNCTCADGWMGETCQQDVDECLSSPCANGGTCKNVLDGFLCSCSHGWQGVNCSTPWDVCEVFPCLNGGTCKNFQFYVICMCAQDYEGVICEMYTGPTSTVGSFTSETSTAESVSSGNFTEVMLDTSTEETSTSETSTSEAFVNETSTPAACTSIPATYIMTSSICQFSTRPPMMGTASSDNVTSRPGSTAMPSTMEPPPITRIEDYISTQDPTTTTITTYTQLPAFIELILETTSPATTSDIKITTIPDNVFEVVNITEIGVTVLEITLSEGAYTTILVTTTQPSDMLLSVATVDAENTAMLLFGVLNITLPTTLPMTETPVVEKKTFFRYLSTAENTRVVAFVATGSAADYQLLVYTENPMETSSVQLETTPVCRSTNLTSLINNCPEGLLVSFQTLEAVNTTLLITLKEAANISFQVTTADPLSIVELSEDTSYVKTQNYTKMLGTQGSSILRAFASSGDPTKYTLTVNTRNPSGSVDVDVETIPSNRAQNLRFFTRGETEAYYVTFETFEAANTTMIITLMEPGNVTFQFSTEDDSGIITLEEYSPEPLVRALSTQGRSVVTASASTRSPADYILLIYTKNPNDTANVVLETLPANVSYDVRYIRSDNPEAWMLTFKTIGEVNATLLLQLMEAANISFQVTTADQSSSVELTEYSTEPEVVEPVLRRLSTQGSSVVRAFASTRYPANYTLIIYTTNPNDTANVVLETSPANVSYDVRYFRSDNPEALMVTFKTLKEVNATLLLQLMKAANISFQVTTADQSSSVELAEYSTEPEVVEPVLRTLSTQGSSIVRAFASTRYPANYTLIIYTTNPNDTANVVLETMPANLSYDVRYIRSDNPEALMVTFQTFEEVNATLLLQLIEAANISFQVTTADQSSSVELAEYSTEPEVVDPVLRTLSTPGSSVVRAFASTRYPANYTLIIYTTNPNDTANVVLETSPANVSYDVRYIRSDNPEALMVTFKTIGEVNATLLLQLMEAANISFQVTTADQSSSVELTEYSTEPEVVDPVLRTLSTPGSSVVRAFASTRYPANYTLIIYTTNPNDTANVVLETMPANVTYDVRYFRSENPEALTVTFKTLEEVNATLLLQLMEAANISFQVTTADQSSSVELTEYSTEPEVVDPVLRRLSTPGSSVVRAFASTRYPANYTLIIYTTNPNDTANVVLETSPANVSYDVRYIRSDNPEALMVTFKTLEEVNATLLLQLMEAANISFQVTTADQSSSVELTEYSTEPEVVEPVLRSLSTLGSSVVRAFASTRSPANYTLIIYTTNPNDTANVILETMPANVSFDVRYFKSDNPEALMVTFKTLEEVNATLLLQLMEAANISFQVTTADQSSSVELTEYSSVPEVVEPVLRTLSTQGSSVVRAFASTRSPANYTLIIYTTNPNDTANVILETMPANVSFDVRYFKSDNPEALMVTFKTLEEVNATLLLQLMEAANISFQVTTADQSSSVELEEYSTEPEVVEPVLRRLSTQGSSVVRAFASTRYPANYTLIIQTTNPINTANVVLETSPANVSYDVRYFRSDNPEALMVIFKTSEEVNATLLLQLMEAAKISFQVTTADQFSSVELAEYITEPEVVESFYRTLSTQGSKVVRAFTSTSRPANYTLVIYTQNSEQTANFTLETSPADVAFDLKFFRSDLPDALMVTFKTLEAVNATAILKLKESANISLQVNTADKHSVVELGEFATEPEIVQPILKRLSTQGHKVVRAFISTISPANYTLAVYTINPNSTVGINLETMPANVSFDVKNFTGDDAEAYIVTFKTSVEVNATLLISLLESANISLQVHTADQSSIVELKELKSEVTEPLIQTLSTEGESTVKAFATARSPANYTLIIYTRNPNESIEVVLGTSPANASYDVRSMIVDDMEALILTYRTSGGVNSTLLITLQESANISFEIESADQSSEVELAEEDDEMESTVSPTVPPQMYRSLSTEGESTVYAFATARSPANYTLIIYTRNPKESVEVVLETSPANASYDVRSMIVDDMEALILTYRTSGRVNSTLLISLQESANISFEIESADQSSEVELAEEDDEMESTVSPTVPPQMYRSLSTEGESTVYAFATARSPANYTLIIYTRNPNESVELVLETSPANSSYDVRSMLVDDMEALILTYRTSGRVNSTLLITLQESANISFEIESADQSSEVELAEEDDEVESTVSPTVPPQMYRSLSTEGESTVYAFATARSPANYTLIIYTRNPNESIEVVLETSPANASYDVRSMIVDDMEALILTYRTLGGVNSTLLIKLQESANISFEIKSADKSSEVELAEEDDEMESTVSPTVPPQMYRSLSTEGESTVYAFATARSPANYTLIIYTRNPNESVEVVLETSPANASYDVRSMIVDDMEALILTYRTSDTVNSTLLITLQESANISFEIESADQSSEVELAEEDDEVESTVSPTVPPQMYRSLSTEGESTVYAFATARSPANYTLIIYTRNPNESVELVLETSPANASYDVRSMIVDDMEALILTYRTSGGVNSTLLITLQESANISFEIESADQSSEVELAEEDDEMESTVSPTVPPQMYRSLSTEGESTVYAFATARSPANYTLIIYTRNPNESIEVVLETSPANASYDVRSMIVDDMEALILTYRTSGGVNSTLLISLQESANISFEIESADQSSEVELAEEDDGMESTVSPTVPPQMYRSLSTEGESTVYAFATARSPANYTLIIYTRNPNESVEVVLETSPANASYDVRSMIEDDMEALILTYRTSDRVNSTLLITLQESANISFEIESADQSSEVELAEEDDEVESTVSPTVPPQMYRSLSTEGESTVYAFATARSPANYTLIIYTRNPNESVELVLETSPANASYDVRSMIVDDMEALILTYRTSGGVNSTLLITLQESANISFEIESADQSSEVELAEEDDEMESTVSPTVPPQMYRSLSTEGESTVYAFATARSPANYTLIIYTRNPNESIEVVLETSPANASYDVRSMIVDDMEALILTYRTSGGVNSTLLISLQESANISFEIESADQSSEVELAEEDDGMESTVSPTVPPQMYRSLSTEGESTVYAFATARSPANYTLIIYTRNPNESVEVVLETSPANASYDVRSMIEDDMEALILTYRTSDRVNSTLLITLQESANISFEIESADQSSEVELAEEDDEVESTVSPTVPPQMYRSLSTEGESTVYAFATARSPANYTLIIYTRNPNESIEVVLETSPANASYDVRSMIVDDMEALILTYRTSGRVNSTLLISLQESANISFEIESADQSSEVELAEEDDGMESTVSPTVPPQMYRSLSTEGESTVYAFATARSPANYTLIIYTRNPNESVEVVLETSPANASYDVRSMMVDDMEALILTYRTLGGVNSTLLITLQESANISFEIESADQSSEVELAEEDDEMESTVSPTVPPQMYRSLSTEGESTVYAFATARSPANYTLIIYTRNPNESVELVLETSPANASYDVRSMMVDDMEALILTYRTSGGVNSTLLITLQESANISFEIESADQSSEVELAEEDDEMESTVSPTVPPQMYRSLSTEGESTVYAFATARSPANYTLIIYTRNPNESVEVVLETSPANASYEVRSMIEDDMEALILTYRTSGRVNSTLLISLQESANISFEIESADQSSEVELAEEDDGMESTVSPTVPPQMYRSLSTEGESTVYAFATARSPANYTLIIYTRNPNESVEVVLETSPANASYDVRSMIEDDMEALILTYRTSDRVNSTLLITLQESANISFEIESADQSSEVELAEEDDEVESTVSPTVPPQMYRSLSTEGESTVYAFATARSPANYTLIIYTRNPNESIEVVLETSPANASYDVRSMIVDDMEALILTYRTSGRVNSTLLITLQESANISFEIESADQSSEVELAEEDDEMESTVSPTVPPQMYRSLSTEGESTVYAFATARSSANYTLIIYTRNPNESVEVVLETSPANASYDVRSMIVDDMEALILTYRTSGRVNSTLLISLQESANISFEIESADQSSEVELAEEDDGIESTVSPTVPPQMYRSLSTEGESTVYAFATARSPANYTLIIYTRNPNESVEVVLETSPANASYDVRSMIEDDMEALILTYRTSDRVNSTLLITLQESANISFEIESADQSSEVELAEEDDEVESTVSPTVPPQMYRSLSTEGESTVYAFATARSPANYTLIIYTRNPNESIEVVLETSPANASYDVRSMIVDDMEALILTYRTSGRVNSTLLISLQESANISFDIESADQSSEVELAEEDDGMESTVSPTVPPQMYRSLSTEGESTVYAFATARGPANYTLIIYTRNPNESVEVVLETSPANASYEVRSMIEDDMEALILTYRTSGGVNSTLLITLQESANISFEIESADQSSEVELAEEDDGMESTVSPTVPPQMYRSLSTEGESTVYAFATARSPANYTLIIYTRNPNESVEVVLETSPANASYEVRSMIEDDMEALILTYRTSDRVNSTLLITLQESANISFEIESADQSSEVELAEEDDEVESTVSPTVPPQMYRSLSTEGESTVYAFATARSPANYTLIIYTRNPNESVELVLETSPANASYDVRSMIVDDMEALILTYRTSGRVNSTLLITLQESANISFDIESADQSSEVELAEEDDEVESTVSPTVPPQMYRSLSTEGESTVYAFATARSPANYTLIIYTRNPNESVEVVLETSPANASYEVRSMIEDDMEALILTYRTSDRVNSTLLISLQESANISFEIESADQSSEVELAEEDDGIESTVSPTVPPQMYRSLSTEGESTVYAFATARSPANYTLIIYTRNPNESVEVVLETSPANASYDVRSMIEDDMEALILTYRTSDRVNSTLLITLQESANISFEIESADQSSEVELAEEDDEVESTVSPTVPPQMYRSLSTEGESTVYAFATARSPANYTLIIYTRNPNESIEVVLETSPANASYEVRSMIVDDMEALILTYRTSGRVNSTLLISLQESANISFDIESADQSSEVELAEEDDGMESTVSPTVPPQMYRSLSTEGESTVYAFATARGPANYTLIIYTRNPNESVEVVLETSPANASYEVRSMIEDDMEALILTYRTSGGVNSTLLITLQESANISFEIESADQSSEVELAEEDDGMESTVSPTVPPQMYRSLSTEGESTVYAFATARSPANYTLIIYTRNPNESVEVVLETSPANASYEVRSMIEDDMEALILTYRTSDRVNSTLLITLQESANISFEIESADQSSEVELAEEDDEVESTVSPTVPPQMYRSLSTEGESTVYAFATARSPANYTLIIYTRNPNESVELVLETSPANASYDVRSMIVDDMEALILTYRTSGRVNSTLLITLQESANISFDIESADQSSEVELAEEDDEVESTVSPTVPPQMYRSLSTEGESTVYAFATARSPANYTLIIYTRNPNESVEVVLETSPANASYEVRSMIEDDMEALILTYRTSDRVNSTLLITLQESANISFEIESADQSSEVELAEEDDEVESTVSPTVPPQMYRSLSTEGESTVYAFATARSPANYTLIIYTRNPNESVELVLETSPANASYDVRSMIVDDMEALILTYKTSGRVNSTLLITLQESANISFDIESADQSSEVELAEEDDEVESTVSPTVPPQMYRSLSTEGESTVYAFATARSPANYTLIIYTRNPNESIEVVLETSPANASYDVRSMIVGDMEALILTYRTSGRVNSTLLITLQESANISFEIESADQSSEVELAEEDDEMESTVSPTVPPQMYRSLSTEGESTVYAFATARSPANYTLIIYTRNPNESVEVVLETSPANASYDVRSMIVDDMEALILTYRTSGRVNSTLLITLQESANISFEIESGDQVNNVDLAEYTVFRRTLSTQGNSAIRAFASSRSLANFLLVIYTSDPGDTANVSISTVPGNVAFDVTPVISDEPEALTISFNTLGEVNTTLFITLEAPANISFKVETLDPDSSVDLFDVFVETTPSPTLPSTMITTVRPAEVFTFRKALFAFGDKTVLASVDTNGLTMYTLLVYALDAVVDIQTLPEGLAMDVGSEESSEALITTFSTLEPTNSKMYVNLNGPAIVTLKVDSTDASTVVSLAELTEVVTEHPHTTAVGTTVQLQTMTSPTTEVHDSQVALNTSRSALIEAFASTSGPANFTLFVYTMNPSENVAVAIETQPTNLTSDVKYFFKDDEQALAVLFTVMEPANTTLRITVMDASRIILNVESDSELVVLLDEVESTSAEIPTMTSPTTEVHDSQVALNTSRSALIEAFASTSGPANFTLFVYTMNPIENVAVAIETQPANLTSDVKYLFKGDEQALAVLFTVMEPANTTLRITVMDASRIILNVESDSELFVLLDEVESTSTEIPTMTSPTTEVHDSQVALNTSRSALIEAFASTSGPANFTLFVYTMNPSENVAVVIETQPANLTSDVKYLFNDDEQALAVLFTVMEPANTTLRITVMDASRIILNVESDSELVVLLEETESTSREIPTTGDVLTSTTDLPSTTESAVVQIVSSNFTISGPANVSFRFDLVKPATIYIMLNASSEGRLSSVPDNAVQLESIIEDGNSRYTLTSMTSSNVTFVLTAYDEAIIVTTVEAIDANDVDVVIDTILKPTDEPDVGTTPHIFDTTTSFQTTPTSLQPVTIIRTLRTSGVTEVEALASTHGPAKYNLTVNTLNPSQNTRINVLVKPNGVATNFQVSASPNQDAITLQFLTSQESDVIVYLTVLEDAFTTFTVETVGLSSTADLISDAQPSTASPTSRSTMLTEMMSATMIDLSTLMTRTPSGSVRFQRSLGTEGVALIHAVSTTAEPAYYELVVAIPDPNENTEIGLLTDPQGLVSDLSITEDNTPQTMTVRFRVREPAYTLISMTLLKSANISFSVETADTGAVVDLLDMTHLLVTPGTTPEGEGGSSSVATTPVETLRTTEQPSTTKVLTMTSTVMSTVTDVVTEVVTDVVTDKLTSSVMDASTTTPSMGPLAPLSITRTLMTMANVDVQAFASLDRPAGMKVEIYTNNPRQTTGISVLTDPQGQASDFMVQTSRNPDKFTMTFRTVAAAETFVFLNLLEAANTSFTVETASRGSASNQVTLMLVGDSTIPPPITEMTIPVVVNTSQSIFTRGPSQSTIFINAISPASVLIDVNGSAVYTWASDSEDAFQVERFSLPDLGSFMRLNISRAVNITVTLSTTEDVEIVTTVISMTSDAAVVTLVAESFSTSTLQPTQVSTEGRISATELPVTMTRDPVSPGTAVRTLRTLSRGSTVQASAVTSRPAEFLFEIFTPNPRENVFINVQTNPSGRAVNFENTVDDDKDKMIVKFKVGESSDTQTLVTLTLNELANVSFTVTNVDEASQVTLQNLSEMSPTTPGGMTETGTRHVEILTPEEPSVTVIDISTTNPVTYTVIISTSNPNETVEVSAESSPDTSIAESTVSLTSYVIVVTASEATNISFYVTTLKSASISVRVDTADAEGTSSVQFSTEAMPDMTTSMQFSNVSRTTSTPGGATTVVSVQTLEPSTIYLIVNASAEISIAADPLGSVETDTLHMLGSSVLKITTAVPTNITLFIMTSDAAVIEAIVSSFNPSSAVILIQDVVSSTLQPPLTSIVMTTTRTRGDATIIEVEGVFSDEVTVFWSFNPEDEPFIRGFILQYREVGVEEWTNSSLIQPSSRLFKVTGLRENTLYFLRLIAVDRSTNPAAFSFQKPVKTLSRNIMDPVPDQDQVTSFDPFYWILIASVILIVVLLVSVVASLILYTRGKTTNKYSVGGGSSPVIQDDQV